MGLLVSPVCYFAVTIAKKKLGYDDSLDAFGCHGVGGIFGAISTGVFATKSVNPLGADGLLAGNASLVGFQLIAEGITIVWSGLATFLILKGISLFIKLRVSDRSGIAAADPDLLPVGSVVQIAKLPDRYNGIYTVMDTGPKVHGRHLDLYIWNCDEALELGRRDMVITVLRLGWNPRNSTPRLVDRLFRQREAASRPRRPIPSRPSSRSRAAGSPACQFLILVLQLNSLK